MENHRLLRRTLSQMLTAERILRTGSWSQWSRNQPTFVLLTYHTFGLTARSLLFLFIFAFFSASRKWKENYLQALENRLLLAWRYLSKDESNVEKTKEIKCRSIVDLDISYFCDHLFNQWKQHVINRRTVMVMMMNAWNMKERDNKNDGRFIIQQSSCNVETLTMERFSAGLFVTKTLISKTKLRTKM